MFGDPLSLPAAIIEVLLILILAAFLGWLIARLWLNGRIEALKTAIADKESALEDCRRSKKAAQVVMPSVAPRIEVSTPPMPVVETVMPVFEAVVPLVAAKPATSEDAVLNRIAARASELNFDRIGLATADQADDLKEIVGVGPFLEKKLHSLGIYTFRQVANFAKEDIDKVNDIIEFFPGRIERDNWVGQSKVFYEKKYGGAA
jgi:predicted flap endonuclease-1-like 5' DNA nuclease